MSAGSLSDRDVHALVSALGRGEQPRIAVVSAHAEVPAGTKATLVGYEPDTDSPFTVRLADGSEVAAPATVLAVVPRGRAEIIARTASGEDTTGPDSPAPADTAPADPAPTGTAPTGADGSGADPAPAKRAKAAKAAPKKPAKGGGEVVITVTVAGDGATVEATHGTRKLVKGAALPVGAGHALAQLVNLEPVTAAVEAVIAEHRTAKEAEAEQLRSRLAELERELAEYQDIDAPA
ncbi:hypothetical protein [Actinocatenispora rupis]|uniref:Uncharacterized protein n=1 Tax=Actinocatenispora rupis TaxID=519421 RepID=A0A8J3JHM5_9ACTN|nr:hypothetical protein [Actinocatenispora rupis]GID15108.1 hypothetical protein Aru02nite_59970 [Actinocatenispora rupis]